MRSPDSVVVRMIGFSSEGSSKRIGEGSGVGIRDGSGDEEGSGDPDGSGEEDVFGVGEGSGVGVAEEVTTLSRTPRRSMLAMAWSGRMVTTLVPAGVVMVSSLVWEFTERG